jgi:hypothetical protein
VLLAALLPAPAALALPGDPLVTPLLPANGARLSTNHASIAVSYACPVYRTNDFGDGTVRYGDERDYVVMLSSSPTLDGEGRLAGPAVRATGSSTAADPNTCNVTLAATTTPAPQDTPGTWYWQVSRLCAGCSPPFETGPVRSFTLVSSERPTLRVPDRVYAGYPFIAAVGARGAPGGTEVTVQRAVGSRWITARPAHLQRPDPAAVPDARHGEPVHDAGRARRRRPDPPGPGRVVRRRRGPVGIGRTRARPAARLAPGRRARRDEPRRVRRQPRDQCSSAMIPRMFLPASRSA